MTTPGDPPGVERAKWLFAVCILLGFTVAGIGLMAGSMAAVGVYAWRHSWGNAAFWTVSAVVWLAGTTAIGNAGLHQLEQRPTEQSDDVQTEET